MDDSNNGNYSDSSWNIFEEKLYNEIYKVIKNLIINGIYLDKKNTDEAIIKDIYKIWEDRAKRNGISKFKKEDVESMLKQVKSEVIAEIVESSISFLSKKRNRLTSRIIFENCILRAKKYGLDSEIKFEDIWRRLSKIHSSENKDTNHTINDGVDDEEIKKFFLIKSIDDLEGYIWENYQNKIQKVDRRNLFIELDEIGNSIINDNIIICIEYDNDGEYRENLISSIRSIVMRIYQRKLKLDIDEEEQREQSNFSDETIDTSKDDDRGLDD